MAKKQKKTRKELLKEPDEFMTLTGKVIGFAVDHRTQLTYGLGIVLALVIIVSGVRFFSIRAEKKSAAADFEFPCQKHPRLNEKIL